MATLEHAPITPTVEDGKSSYAKKMVCIPMSGPACTSSFQSVVTALTVRLIASVHASQK